MELNGVIMQYKSFIMNAYHFIHSPFPSHFILLVLLQWSKFDRFEIKKKDAAPILVFREYETKQITM